MVQKSGSVDEGVPVSEWVLPGTPRPPTPVEALNSCAQMLEKLEEHDRDRVIRTLCKFYGIYIDG